MNGDRHKPRKLFKRAISVNERLPKERTYVLVHYKRGNWIDSDDQEGCEWKVAKLIRGISKAERNLLSNNNPRKKLWTVGDEGMNNERPYRWETFGHSDFFGQDIDYWCELPKLV